MGIINSGFLPNKWVVDNDAIILLMKNMKCLFEVTIQLFEELIMRIECFVEFLD